jgi:glycosyltransferase involved in cell wall biosynthesis
MEKRLLKHVIFSYTYGDDLTKKYNKMGYLAKTLYNSKGQAAVPKINKMEINDIKWELGIKKDDYVVGFSGSVSLKNGTQQIMDALKNLPDSFKFLVVGGSGQARDMDEAKRYAEKKGVRKNIVFTGRVPPDVLLRYTAAFDLGTALIQPLSANEIARVPNKLFDYMAMGVPMLVSNFPNMRKIVVEEAKCGVAVNPMDVKAITKAVKHFYEHPEDAKKKGESGRDMFERVYSWDVQKKKLMKSHRFWRGEI